MSDRYEPTIGRTMTERNLALLKAAYERNDAHYAALRKIKTRNGGTPPDNPIFARRLEDAVQDATSEVGISASQFRGSVAALRRKGATLNEALRTSLILERGRHRHDG